MKTVTIYYFSGTGCTRAVVNAVAENLKEKAHVTLKNMEEYIINGMEVDISADEIGLAFPIYAFGTPTYVDEFLSLMPGSSKEIFLLNVSGGGGETVSNRASTHFLKKKLNKKGYSVRYESSFIMPSNWASGPGHDEAVNMYKNALEQSKKVAEDVLGKKVSLRAQPPFISRLISFMGRGEHFGARIYGKSLHSTSACTDCGWCVKNCPKENIKSVNGKMIFGDACAFCMRCVYGCPENAIEAGHFKFAVLKDGFNIQKIVSEVTETKG